MTVRFDWDTAKDAENQLKHGVSFVEAERAFLDPGRLIAHDTAHSQDEQRYFCFARVGERVLTVRFTYRGDVIRIIGAGYWRQGRKWHEAKKRLHG